MDPIAYITNSTASPYTDYVNMNPRFYLWYNSEEPKTLDDAWNWIYALDLLKEITYYDWNTDLMDKYEQMSKIRTMQATANLIIRRLT